MWGSNNIRDFLSSIEVSIMSIEKYSVAVEKSSRIVIGSYPENCS